MVTHLSNFIGAVLAALTVSTAALAQSYYDDQACRQFADAQVAPLRDQANSQAVGSTLLGAGLGAALGGAVGGVRLDLQGGRTAARKVSEHGRQSAPQCARQAQSPQSGGIGPSLSEMALRARSPDTSVRALVNVRHSDQPFRLLPLP